MRVTTVLCMVVYRWFNAMHFSQMAWNYSSRGYLLSSALSGVNLGRESAHPVRP